jgi:hypothetical protein
MFWIDKSLSEEEWSLSAKLFAGMVFNPFSLVNTCNNTLFAWFWKKITGNELPKNIGWRAKPEYLGNLGRNDWRLHLEEWQIAIECKFGDGIDIRNDCLKYFNGLNEGFSRVALVASVSELSELTEICQKSSKQVNSLLKKLNNNEVVLIAWHEIVDESIKRLPKIEGEILQTWAYMVKKNTLLLMPEKRISGDQIVSMIKEGKNAGIPFTHKKDARKDRRSTATLEDVCIKQNVPNWVFQYMKSVRQTCIDENLIFETKRSGWVNLRKNKKCSLTLLPWFSGVAILISHPKDPRLFDSFLSLKDLDLHGIVPDKEEWFPSDRTIGITYKNKESCTKEDFVTTIMNTINLL